MRYYTSKSEKKDDYKQFSEQFGKCLRLVLEECAGMGSAERVK